MEDMQIPKHIDEQIDERVSRYGTREAVLEQAMTVLARYEQAEERLEALLIEGLDSPESEMTDEEWVAIEREGLEILNEREASARREASNQ